MIPIVKRHNYHNPDMRYKQGGILKAQKGKIIKALAKAVTKPKKVELTGDLFAETPKSIVSKPKNFRGYSINPEAFSGTENLTPYH